MAGKKTYAPYEGQAYSTVLPNGKAVQLAPGETYDTSDEAEQRELDETASRADSGLKDVTKKGKAD